MCRTVWRPKWLRAPVLFLCTTSEYSGPPLCNSTLTSGIAVSLQLRRRAEFNVETGLQAHVGLLHPAAPSGPAAEIPDLVRIAANLHRRHPHLEHAFHRQ